MSTLKAMLISLGLIVIFFTGFLVGTMAGFHVAVKEISECEEVECELLGIESAQVCEICPERGLKIIKSQRR